MVMLRWFTEPDEDIGSAAEDNLHELDLCVAFGVVTLVYADSINPDDALDIVLIVS